MARPEFASMLERSNQELIDNLNSRRYIPPPVQMPTDNPLYQNVMGTQGYDDPYALERRVAQGRASRAYADAMEAQASREALHTGIGTALMAIPMAGIPLSFAYKPFAKAMGWLDPEEIYSQADYTKAQMAETMTNTMMGQMGASFIGGNLSMDQANNLSDDIYGFMRQRGFQGLELGRMMPMLGESGLLAPTGKFTNAEEALTQFENRLEGFLDKISTTVRTTSLDIESATALTVSESMLAGSRDAVAGGGYLSAARLMSSITGGSIQESDVAMRSSLGDWGSTVFDRRALAEASVFNVNAAVTAGATGGQWDAAWLNLDPAQFGLQMAGRGNQYWMSNRKDLARMWSAGAMPGTDAWGDIVAGEGMPEDIGSYGDIGNINARLEAQYYGMQVAAENPNQMTAASMGMLVHNLRDRGITSRRAQVAEMVNKGWRMDEAAAMFDMYDQLSSPGGRMESYMGAAGRFDDLNIKDFRSGVESLISGVGVLSNEVRNEELMNLSGEFASNIALNPQSALASTRAWAADNRNETYNLDPSYGVNDRFNISAAGQALTGLMEARGLGGEQESRDIMGGALRRLTYKELGDVRFSVNNARDFNIQDWMTAEYARRTGGRYFGGAEEAWEYWTSSDERYQELLGMEVSGGHILGEILTSTNRDVSIAGDPFRAAMSAEVIETTTEGRRNYAALERMYNTGYGGDLINEAAGLAMAGGYMENIEYMSAASRGSFQTADRNMQAVMFLGGIKEEYIDYNNSNAYRDKYQSFLGNLSSQDVRLGAATAGLDPNNAENQITVRDTLAQAGFGKSYSQIDQIERDFIERYVQDNDISGRGPEDREWAGPHEDLVDDARSAALTAAGDVEYGAIAGYERAVYRATRLEDVSEQQLSTYAAYAVAVQEGDTELAQSLKDELGEGQFGQAQRAYARFQGATGLGTGTAAGAILSTSAFGAVERGAAQAGIAGRSEEMYKYIQEHGSLSGFDVTGIDTESALYKAATGSADDMTNFWRSTGLEGPTWDIPNEPTQNRLTNIPEFEGAVHAIVTPAGPAMPVVVENAEELQGYRELYPADSEAVEGVSE